MNARANVDKSTTKVFSASSQSAHRVCVIERMRQHRETKKKRHTEEIESNGKNVKEDYENIERKKHEYTLNKNYYLKCKLLVVEFIQERVFRL